MALPSQISREREAEGLVRSSSYSTVLPRYVRCCYDANWVLRSFMEIFDSDGDKIDELNKKLCEKAGFPGIYPVSTQTVCH